MAAVALAALAGCPATSTNKPASSPSEPAIPPIDLAVKSWDEIEQHIAARQGKVIVVDLWSTTCDPCRREFPGLVALQRQFAGDVDCISVSTDYYGDPTEPPESFREVVTGFLREQGAAFDHFLSSDSSDELMRRIGTAGVPVVLVYDRQGALHTRFDNDEAAFGDEGFTYREHVAPLVASLVSGEGG